MAVTNNGNRIKFGAAADAVTGRHKIQAILLDHTAAANCVIKDTGDKEIITMRNTTGTLSEVVYFPCGLWVDGIKVTTLSAGAVTVFTA